MPIIFCMYCSTERDDEFPDIMWCRDPFMEALNKIEDKKLDLIMTYSCVHTYMAIIIFNNIISETLNHLCIHTYSYVVCNCCTLTFYVAARVCNFVSTNLSIIIN